MDSSAKGQVDTLPMGTRRDVYHEGYEWVGQCMPYMLAQKTLLASLTHARTHRAYTRYSQRTSPRGTHAA